MSNTNQELSMETTKGTPAASRDNMTVAGSNDGASFLPQSMNEAVSFADLMCKADIALPKFLRGNKGACLAISMQAYRWGMDPFAVANKAYSVNDRVAYESQLIASVINTRAPLQNRLVVAYEGKDGTRKCIVTGRFHGEDIDRVVSSPPFNAITTKNSPLWKSDPDQQLFYYTVRTWARRYVPELLMGVYSVDETETMHRGPGNAKDVTPPAPTRAEFQDDEEVDGVIEHEGEGGAEDLEQRFSFVDEESVDHSYDDAAAFVEQYVNYLTGITNPDALSGVWETNMEEIGRLRDVDQLAADGVTEVFMNKRGELDVS